MCVWSVPIACMRQEMGLLPSTYFRLSSPCWYLHSFPFLWQLWQCGEAPSHYGVVDGVSKSHKNKTNQSKKYKSKRKRGGKRIGIRHTLILLSRQGTQAVVTCLRPAFLGFSGSGCIILQDRKSAATVGERLDCDPACIWEFAEWEQKPTSAIIGI